jgi:hypothetical protein
MFLQVNQLFSLPEEQPCQHKYGTSGDVHQLAAQLLQIQQMACQPVNPLSCPASHALLRCHAPAPARQPVSACQIS